MIFVRGVIKSKVGEGKERKSGSHNSKISCQLSCELSCESSCQLIKVNPSQRQTAVVFFVSSVPGECLTAMRAVFPFLALIVTAVNVICACPFVSVFLSLLYLCFSFFLSLHFSFSSKENAPAVKSLRKKEQHSPALLLLLCLYLYSRFYVLFYAFALLHSDICSVFSFFFFIIVLYSCHSAFICKPHLQPRI